MSDMAVLLLTLAIGAAVIGTLMWIAYNLGEEAGYEHGYNTGRDLERRMTDWYEQNRSTYTTTDWSK